MSRATRCVCVLAAIALIPLSSAEQNGEVHIRSVPYQPAVGAISVETNLVELAATVRDQEERVVGGLQASDFLVRDNQKQQKITFFAEQRAQRSATTNAKAGDLAAALPPADSAKAQPRFIALFFDDMREGLAGFDRARKAAEKLITEGMPPGDRVGIFTGSGSVSLDFTADTKSLLAALAGMRRHPDRSASFGFGVCPSLTTYQAYVIAKHLDPMAKDVAVADIRACTPQIPEDEAAMQAQDAAENAWSELRYQSTSSIDVLMLIVRRLATLPGQRILLMVSPGFVTDEGMERQREALARALLRSQITMNALDDEGLLSGGAESPESLRDYRGPRLNWADRTLGERGQTVTAFMADVTATTGGEFIYNNNDLAAGLKKLVAAPPVTYVLGFSPLEKPNGKYHKLKVTIAKTGSYRVTTRPGYFSNIEAQQPETAQQHIDRVVASAELLDQVPASLRVYSVPGKEGLARIRVDITLDAKRLPFRSLNGASIQQITFVTVLQDAAGHYLEGKESFMDLSLAAADRSALERDGLKANTSFSVPLGSYRIREVIREAVHNGLAASTSSIEIR